MSGGRIPIGRAPASRLRWPADRARHAQAVLEDAHLAQADRQASIAYIDNVALPYARARVAQYEAEWAGLSIVQWAVRTGQRTYPYRRGRDWWFTVPEELLRKVSWVVRWRIGDPPFWALDDEIAELLAAARRDLAKLLARRRRLVWTPLINLRGRYL